MHRVNLKHKQARILRIVAYSVTLTLSVLTTVLLLYIALGYRFDGKSGHVVRSGLLLVDSRPESGAVYINDEIKDNATPGRFVLSAGSYNVKLVREGYRNWAKKVKVAASGVREVNYPLLLPTTLNATKLFDTTSLDLVSQSQDRKTVLLHTPGAANFERVALDPKSPQREILNMSDAFTKEAGAIGSLAVREWALDNKHVLLQHTLSGGRSELISFDVTKPENAINITALYGENTPVNVHYVGSDTARIYGTKDGALGIYKLDEERITPILDSIRVYKPYANDTVIFNRLNAKAQAETGIWKDGTTTVIHSSAVSDGNPMVDYAKFDDHYYFVVAEPSANTVTVYRDPLQSPILTKQLPLTTLTFNNVQKIDFSGSAQFLLLQNGKNILVYDFDDLRQFAYTLPFEVAPGTLPHWINATHIEAQATDGMNYLMEYDGQNQQALVQSIIGRQLLFSDNYESLYRLSESEALTNLDVVSMVYKK